MKSICLSFVFISLICESIAQRYSSFTNKEYALDTLNIIDSGDTEIYYSKSWSFNVGLNARSSLYTIHRKKNVYQFLDFNYMPGNYGGFGLKFQVRRDLLNTTIVFEPIFRYDDIFFDTHKAKENRGFIIDSSLYLLWRKRKFNIGFGGISVNSNVVITYQPIGQSYTRKKYIAIYGLAMKMEKNVKKYFVSSDLIYIGYNMKPFYGKTSSSFSLQGSIIRTIDFKQEK